MSSDSASKAGTKRRMRIWLICIVLFMSWAGYTFFEQVAQYGKTRTKLSTVEDKINTIKQENEELKQQIERLNDPEYVEQLARKDQGMVKEGEQQIQVVE